MKALIADDEPFYLEWLDDFLTSKGIESVFVTNIEDAIEELSKENFRFMVVDLNIPVSAAFEGEVKVSTDILKTYPGLYLADYARNNGYRTRQVIVYSVHVNESIKEYVSKLYCTFIPKGRPSLLKDEIVEVLDYDPTEPEK